jgi:hypothetical protein
MPPLRRKRLAPSYSGSCFRDREAFAPALRGVASSRTRARDTVVAAYATRLHGKFGGCYVTNLRPRHIGHLTDPSPLSRSVAATPAGLKAPQRQTL